MGVKGEMERGEGSSFSNCLGWFQLQNPSPKGWQWEGVGYLSTEWEWVTCQLRVNKSGSVLLHTCWCYHLSGYALGIATDKTGMNKKDSRIPQKLQFQAAVLTQSQTWAQHSRYRMSQFRFPQSRTETITEMQVADVADNSGKHRKESSKGDQNQKKGNKGHFITTVDD